MDQELDHKESWVPKNWCFQIGVREKTLDSPLDSKEIKPVNPKGNQLWIFIGRPDAEALILWPPAMNSWFTGKDSGKDWKQKKKEVAEDEMVGWHYQLNRHDLEQTLGDSRGQRSLMYCSPWGLKESDRTEQLNNNNPGCNKFQHCSKSDTVCERTAMGHSENPCLWNILGHHSVSASCDRI